MDTSEQYIKMEEGLPDKPIPHTAIAYIAGLIDGEGTISLRRKIGNHYNIEVYITNTNLCVLEWVQKTLQMGKIFTFKPRPPRKTQIKWHVHSRNAEKLLNMVQPYLIIKQGECLEAIMFRELMNRDTSWHAHYAELFKKHRATNHLTKVEPEHHISQDQLQAMLPEFIAKAGFVAPVAGHFANFAVACANNPLLWGLVTFEQLWLAFYMKQQYNKIWDGSEWVNANL